MSMSKGFMTCIYIFIGAVILSAILLGLRSTALKSAYDTTAGFNVTDSAGTVHSVAASGISGDTVALLYALGAGLVWLIAVVAMVLVIVSSIKHGG